MVHDHCTFCGSLDPAVFMRMLRERTVLLGPTDKSYKVYVTATAGAPFARRRRTDPGPFFGDFHPAHTWELTHRASTKFYFQHLDEPQRLEFVELLKSGVLQFESGHGFYVLPFFIRVSREAPRGAA